MKHSKSIRCRSWIERFVKEPIDLENELLKMKIDVTLPQSAQLHTKLK
ncbi:hypothetical protein [Pallidibacillus thermolactis]|nr:hypothetical protein [Pallidibacillus thermolactis]MCU9601352.1 hypothetical protein [Pallidibacillus thermolactis subsp. kokeshiiformis]MCU9602646.1 hypothetical protein [Pallidibacillus thermolactis subsp. kokeshiiformis]